LKHDPFPPTPSLLKLFFDLKFPVNGAGQAGSMLVAYCFTQPAERGGVPEAKCPISSHLKHVVLVAASLLADIPKLLTRFEACFGQSSFQGMSITAP
jgi:hypothetical protein